MWLGIVLDDSFWGIEGIKGGQVGSCLYHVETRLEPASCNIIKPQSAILLDHSIYNETQEEQKNRSKQNGLIVKECQNNTNIMTII